MKVKIYNNLEGMSSSDHKKCKCFLERYIPEGSVVMPTSVYDGAHMWTCIINESGEILGLSAQKVFEKANYSIVQIMATFLSSQIRGRKFASLLLQGEIFLQLLKKHLLKPIYWCTRTRIPSAFAASKRYNNIYPYIDAPERNQNLSLLAKKIAETVYGNQISLCDSTYLLKDSYQGEYKFSTLPTNSNSGKIAKYFQNHIDYKKNQAIFILGKLSQHTLEHYLINKKIPTPNDSREGFILTNDILRQCA